MLHVLVKTGLKYQKADNQEVIMKSPRQTDEVQVLSQCP